MRLNGPGQVWAMRDAVRVEEKGERRAGVARLRLIARGGNDGNKTGGVLNDPLTY